MTNENPATPATAATPGNDANNGNGQPAATPAVTTGQGGNEEGKVTISTKEFAQLQRDAARGRSAAKRIEIRSKSNAGNGNAALPDDVATLIDEANDRANKAEQKAAQAEVRGRVRDILDKPEFKVLPESTRNLILKNPSALSQAEDPEEALLDIEDYVRDEVAKLGTSTNGAGQGNAGAGNAPAVRETPPVVNNGSPAPTKAAEAEDPSKLRGSARSQAMIRNSLKGVKPV